MACCDGMVHQHEELDTLTGRWLYSNVHSAAGRSVTL